MNWSRMTARQRLTLAACCLVLGFALGILASLAVAVTSAQHAVIPGTIIPANPIRALFRG